VTAQEFLSLVSQAIFLGLFVVATIRLVRRPSWATLDTFLFFAIIATILVAGDVAGLLGFEGHPALNVVTWVGISALPFVLLRLVDDFRPQPAWIMAFATVGWIAVALVGILAPQPWGPVSLVVVAFVVVLGIYASIGFLREALTSSGVTRRRMQAVALGSVLLAVVLLLAGVNVVFPSAAPAIQIVNQVASLVLVVAYFVGFAPPAILLRAWQEPTLRALLAEAAQLVQLPDAGAAAKRIADRAAAATGADGASVGLWDEQAQELVFDGPDGVQRVKPGDFIAGRVLVSQRPIFSSRAERDAPEHADVYRATGIHAIAAAPITAGDRRLGVLVVYAARPPLFTDDVLSLVGLLSEQAALVLRGQQLLLEAAQVRAMAEMTRLKDDFLSVVAHDVRTPLTTILLNAELLEKGLEKASTNARRAISLRTEALRLKQLVEDYLDVVRADQGRPARREEHDLVALVLEAVEGVGNAGRRVTVGGEASLPGSFDGPRVQQLVQNLVSNALKYSEPGEPISVEVAVEGDEAVLSVTDQGIGIPDSDQAILFERFHRGQNTDDRRYGGLGLGLYICKQIAEEHGGTIAVRSRVGEGSTFVVRLPRYPVGHEAPAAASAAEAAVAEAAADAGPPEAGLSEAPAAEPAS
jgi:signal transduction histidine kinase